MFQLAVSVICLKHFKKPIDERLRSRHYGCRPDWVNQICSRTYISYLPSCSWWQLIQLIWVDLNNSSKFKSADSLKAKWGRLYLISVTSGRLWQQRSCSQAQENRQKPSWSFVPIIILSQGWGSAIYKQEQSCTIEDMCLCCTANKWMTSGGSICFLKFNFRFTVSYCSRWWKQLGGIQSLLEWPICKVNVSRYNTLHVSKKTLFIFHRHAHSEQLALSIIRRSPGKTEALNLCIIPSRGMVKSLVHMQRHYNLDL